MGQLGVAVCFTAAGMNTKPVYAADMGAVYGIFEHGVGWSAYHGDQTAERAGTGSLCDSDSRKPFGAAGRNERYALLSGKLERYRLAFLAGKYDTERKTETDMPLEAVRMELTGQLKRKL